MDVCPLVDVDIVIRLDATFYYSLDDLTPQERAAFEPAHTGGATYTHAQFKAHVLQVLQAAFPGQVTPGNKAIKIAASGTRRSSDVIVAVQFRRYLRYVFSTDQGYALGMCLFDTSFNRIVNYPRQHSANCTAKHGATSSWFKPTVRILKNIRRVMVERGLIGAGLAPSYFPEGLLYNVPNEHFDGSYQDTLIAAINWIIGANRNDFVCANEQYYLLRNSRETWPPVNCDQFLTALVQYWQNWA